MTRRERVLNWLLWSRRNLLLGVGGSVAALILLTVAVSSVPSGTPSGTVTVTNGATSSPTVQPGADEPSPTGPTVTLDPSSSTAATAAAHSFVATWLQGRGDADQASWEKLIQPYAAGQAWDSVRAMMRQARDQIPAAVVASIDVTTASPEGAIGTATLSDGTRLALTLSPNKGRWQVTELDKADA